MKKDIRILVHTQGSANDAHLIEAIPIAINRALERGVKVEGVANLSEIRRRLLLPSSDPQAADGVLSADNTIKILAAVVRHLDPISVRHPTTGQPAVVKPPLAAVLPTSHRNENFILSDAGAHIENDGLSIAAGALLCGSFWRVIRHRQYPRYGVYGFGEEEAKLPAPAREAYQLLRQTKKRVVKIVEPKDFVDNSVEVVVVRNGEIGNTILKTAEAVLDGFGDVVRQEIQAELVTKVGGALVRPAFRRAKDRFYHDDVHGAFFLGITKPVMKHHGRLGANDLFLAIMRLALYVEGDIIPRTRQDFLKQLAAHHPTWIID